MGMRMEDTRTIRNQILCLVSARRHTGSKGDFEAHLSRTDTHARTHAQKDTSAKMMSSMTHMVPATWCG